MNKIIALDDGHGMSTPGKRTPLFEDGSFMHENEFNREVVGYLDQYLQYNGFDTLLVAPTDEDTPLKTRTDLANNTIKNKYNKPADLYISIHANALTGEWGPQGGIETYIYTKVDEETKRLGKIIHSHIIKGTPLRDRGLQQADFHVLRETHMPAVLPEMAFMDNKEEAKLLLSKDYRKECAREVCQGVCEFFNAEYKEYEDSMKDMKQQIPQWKLDKIDRAGEIGYLNEPETWKKDPDQQVPMWAVCSMLNELYEKLKG